MSILFSVVNKAIPPRVLTLERRASSIALLFKIWMTQRSSWELDCLGISSPAYIVALPPIEKLVRFVFGWNINSYQFPGLMSLAQPIL